MPDVNSEAPAVTPVFTIVVKGWPRLSETFIAQELLGLEALGLRLRIVSLRHPTDKAVHELNRRVRAPVSYLPEYLHREPLRVLRGLFVAMMRPGFVGTLGGWLRDLLRDPTRNRVRRFGQACVLVAESPSDAGWVHAHFLHTPASVARYAALIMGAPWSFSAHAKDIWTSPEWEKRQKLASAAWGVTCTALGHRHLEELSPRSGVVELLYHGLDFSRFDPPAEPRPLRDGRDAADPIRLLSVGRAVEKKGFDVALDALARLPFDRAWRWTHIGGGERLAALKARAEALGIADRITWAGPKAQDEVIAAYGAADVFILPARVAADGDQDGLPNVLMEAQAMGLACLATRAGAIGELIEDGVTGRLVPFDDADALTGALRELIDDPSGRSALAAAGHARVRAAFAAAPNIRRLADKMALGTTGRSSSASNSNSR